MFRYIRRRVFETPTETVDNYPGVAVSLEEAHWYSHSHRTGRTVSEAPTRNSYQATDEEDGRFKDADADETRAMLERGAAYEYTIAGLRREIGAGDRNASSYDRTYCLPF